MYQKKGDIRKHGTSIVLFDIAILVMNGFYWIQELLFLAIAGIESENYPINSFLKILAGWLQIVRKNLLCDRL